MPPVHPGGSQTRTAVASPAGAIARKRAGELTPRHDGHALEDGHGRRESTPHGRERRKITQPRTCTGGSPGKPSQAAQAESTPSDQPQHTSPTHPEHRTERTHQDLGRTPFHEHGLYPRQITYHLVENANYSKQTTETHIHSHTYTTHVDCYRFTLPKTPAKQHKPLTCDNTRVTDNRDYPAYNHSKQDDRGMCRRPCGKSAHSPTNSRGHSLVVACGSLAGQGLGLGEPCR